MEGNLLTSVETICAEPVTLREVAPRHRVACHLA
jgi:hypothetical protein